MEIEYGKLYLNRTWKYLYPALRVYEPNLINYLNSLIKVGVGIHDDNFVEEDDNPKIFILIQTKLKDPTTLKARTYNKKIIEFFEYLREQSFYVDDYLYEMSEDSCLHMVVIKYPKNFIPVFNNFKEGAYHKMYHPTVIKNYFPIKSLNQVYNKDAFKIAKTLGNNFEIHGVLKKEDSFKSAYQNIISEDFGIDLKEIDVGDGELDYPPNLKEEIFNL